MCSANHSAGYFSNLDCDWLSIVWAYSEQETENEPRSDSVNHNFKKLLFALFLGDVGGGGGGGGGWS